MCTGLQTDLRAHLLVMFILSLDLYVPLNVSRFVDKRRLNALLSRPVRYDTCGADIYISHLSRHLSKFSFVDNQKIYDSSVDLVQRNSASDRY